jgi:hypothetical protein
MVTNASKVSKPFGLIEVLYIELIVPNELGAAPPRGR